MKRTAMILALVLAWPLVSQAHFLWLKTDTTASLAKAHVYFGEAAEPDDPDLLDKVVKAEVWIVGGRGEPKPLTFTKGNYSLEAPLEGAARQSTLILRHSYGVLTKGGAEPFLLQYYAKSYPFPLTGTWKAVKDSERLPLEVVPSVDGSTVVFQVLWKGQPQADSTVTIVGPGIESKIEGTTNAAGEFRTELPRGGLFSIRAKHTEERAGELNQQAYKSVRSYSTLTLHYEPRQLAPTAHAFPELPKGITSFGGAVVGNAVFAYGGNYGSAHEYANEDQSGDLWKLDLQSPSQWEKIATGPKLQGLAMIEHGGKLYRIGGFTATNKAGEKEDLRSQADFARFDAATNQWVDLPKLPEGRSSHDAAVVGDTVYVVGGWNMQGAGGSTAKWHTDALAYDLKAEKGEWKTIAAPNFERRALALAAWNGRLVCIGGMGSKGGATTDVAIFDPAKDTWLEGPALLGTAMDGFGASAFASGDTLYATTMTGSIQRLEPDAKAWQSVGQLAHPRFFHRVLPLPGNKLVVVGGASMETGKVLAIEILPIETNKTAKR